MKVNIGFIVSRTGRYIPKGVNLEQGWLTESELQSAMQKGLVGEVLPEEIPEEGIPEEDAPKDAPKPKQKAKRAPSVRKKAVKKEG